jgi:hypothetical protein
VRNQVDAKLLRTSLEPNDSSEIHRLTTGPRRRWRVALTSDLQKRLLSEIAGSTSEALGTWESRGSL